MVDIINVMKQKRFSGTGTRYRKKYFFSYAKDKSPRIKTIKHLNPSESKLAKEIGYFILILQKERIFCFGNTCTFT